MWDSILERWCSEETEPVGGLTTSLIYYFQNVLLHNSNFQRGTQYDSRSYKANKTGTHHSPKPFSAEPEV